MRRNHLTPLVLLALTLVVAACGNSDDAPSTEDAVATTEVSVVDNAFEPGAIEIATGDTVTWTWDGSAPHDVDGDGFQSEVQTEGTFEHIFETAGEYQYVCNIHSGMTGVVSVSDQ